MHMNNFIIAIKITSLEMVTTLFFDISIKSKSSFHCGRLYTTK
jgi:hypothetical protein